MPQIHTSKLLKSLRAVRIVILLFPLLTIISSIQQLIVETGNFIVVLTLMVLTYAGHQFHFRSSEKQEESWKYLILEETRKIIVCCLSSYLIALLIAEIYYITVNVYQVSYGDQIVFWFRVIVTMSNMEANMELCDKKHRKHANTME